MPGDDPVVKVLDFGIAKRLGSNLTGTGQAFGTPTYMSPEQAQNRGIDARSDLYSLGCVMYQCVTGNPPFEGDNPLAVLLSHVTDKPAPLRTAAATPLSDEFIAIVDRALSKNPSERFSSAPEMRIALERVKPPPEGATARGLSDSVRLEIDQSAADDDRTAAYQPAPAAVAATMGSQRGLTPPTPGQGGSGHTEAFLLGGDQDAAEPQPAATPKGKAGSVALIIGAAVALVAIGGGSVALFAGGDEGSTGAAATAAEDATIAASADAAGAPVAAVQAAAGAGVAAAAGVQAVAVAEPDAAAAAVDAPVAVAAAPAGPVAVELRTEPSGASVLVDGKEVGQTPFTVQVTQGAPVQALLQRAGFRDLEIVVKPDMAPFRLMTLTADPKKAKPRVGNGPRTRPTSTPSALEERL